MFLERVEGNTFFLPAGTCATVAQSREGAVLVALGALRIWMHREHVTPLDVVPIRRSENDCGDSPQAA